MLKLAYVINTVFFSILKPASSEARSSKSLSKSEDLRVKGMMSHHTFLSH